MARAAGSSRISSTTWTSRKWLPEPSVPHWSPPRGRARWLTKSGSAPGRQPPASVCSRSPGGGPAALGQVGRAFGQQAAEFLAVEQIRAARAHAGRNAAEERVHQLADPRLTSATREIGAHQPHAAVDVVADAAGRDHAAFGRIGGRDAADAEAVAPVDVGHGQAGHLNARQKGHVGHLLGRLVGADLLDQPLVGEDAAFDLHPHFVALRNPPGALVDLLQRTADSLFWT